MADENLGASDAALAIVDVVPAYPSFRSGEDLAVDLHVHSDRDRSVSVRVDAGAPGGTATFVEEQRDVARGRSVLTVRLPAPEGSRAWQITARVSDAGSSATGLTAADVLDDWRTDPRYGFLCDFAPDAAGVPERVARMSRYHLTCVLLYDWAWRHHALLAPEEPYADVLGKPMSLERVREAVASCHDHRMAALGYVTVYAAERDFLDEHADWGLLDDDDRPWHLADLFFLMDPTKGSAWSQHMLGQLEEALTAVELDGFHLDQYGWPREAHVPSGRRVDVAAGLADFVRAANQVVARRRPGGGSIFNNVNAWPLEGMAGTADVATYIEVWRPHSEYRDLVDLVRRAQRSAPGVPVVLAAYAGLLAKTDDPDQAAGGLALLAAVVLASGGWPLLVGEGDRVLTGAYYPENAVPPEPARTALVAVLDAGVAWREFLRGPDVTHVADAFVDGQDREVSVDAPWSSRPLPGHVWVSVARRPGWFALSLVNLLDATSPRWNQPQPQPTERTVSVRLPQGVDRSECWVSGTGWPWERVPVTVDQGGATVRVPLGLWSLVVLRGSGTTG